MIYHVIGGFGQIYSDIRANEATPKFIWSYENNSKMDAKNSSEYLLINFQTQFPVNFLNLFLSP